MLALAFLAALVAAVAGPAGGCARRSGPTWPADNSLTVAIDAPPLHLDPRVGTDAASSDASDLLMHGLLGTDAAGELVPRLAARWETLDGGRRLRFHLRSGVRFHDGRRLGAADVAWTFNSIVDGTVATAKRAAFAALDRVEVVDPLTVDFHLHEPAASFPVELTLGVVPDGVLPAAMAEHPVGTGPFRFVSRGPDRLVLAAFEECFAGRPRLDRLVLDVVPDTTVRVLELLDGSVQLVVNDLPPDLVPRFRADPAYQVVEGPSTDSAYLGFNLRDPALADLRVRRAIAHAIDRERLVATLWRGLGAVTDTLLPPGNWARAEDLPTIPHDPAEARRLLAEAGHERLRLTLKTSTTETYLLQAQVIQAMLADVGIDLEVRALEFATFYEDVKRGNFQLFTLVRTGVLDPHIYHLALHSQSTPPTGHNRGFWSNPRFDALIDRAARLPERERRRPLYVEAQHIVARELPYVSLYTKWNVAVMPAELAGYENHLRGPFLALPQVWWNRPGPAAP
ncbi:MAG TPA: ABC transporter substrate-binding protein [Thermoanaerobaculia bacterium]|nr:ABC transporter substrate-binding protein [Thermoanaerobaculia bacterium]